MNAQVLQPDSGSIHIRTARLARPALQSPFRCGRQSPFITGGPKRKTQHQGLVLAACVIDSEQHQRAHASLSRGTSRQHIAHSQDPAHQECGTLSTCLCRIMPYSAAS